MLHILYGQDDFTLQEELGRLRASLDDGMLSVNTTYLEGAETTPQEVANVCDTVPFLGQQRLVILRGLLRRFEPPQRGRGQAVSSPDLGSWRQLVDYVERLPPTTTLVLTDDEASPSNPLLRALAPKAAVREFRPLRPNAVPKWIHGRARDKGMNVSSQAAHLLADSLGHNLWALDRELDKLANYAPQRRIEEADVRLLVGPARDINVFSLVDAVVEGQASTALRLLRQLMAMGEESGHLRALVVRQYRLLLLARELRQEGAPPQTIAEQLGIASAFVLRKVLEQADGYPLPRLKAAYKRLLEADVAVKRGRLSDDLALELLIADLAGKPAT